MALIVTPTGQQIYVPAGMAGTLGGPAPLALEQTDAYLQNMPGNGAPIQPPPPPPPPPPVKSIGQGGPAPDEVAAPDLSFEQPAPTLGSNLFGSPHTPAPAPVEVPMAAPAAVKPGKAVTAAPQDPFKVAEQEALSANQGQRQAAVDMGQVQSAEAEDVARLKTEGAMRAQELRDKAAADAQERQKAIAERNAKLDEQVTAQANYKIDDNRRWNNLSTGRKVLAGISVVLSGLGNAMAGQGGKENAALALIKGAINDDVQAQMRERENLKDKIGSARNSLDSYRQQTADAAEAGRLKVAEEYKRTADQLEVSAATYGSPKALLEAQQHAEVLRADAAKIIAASAEGSFNRDLKKQEMANAKAQLGISGGHLALAQRAQRFDEKYKLAELNLKSEAMIAAEAKARAAADQGGIGGDVKTTTGADGKPVQTVDILKQPDGSVWQPDKEAKAKIVAQRTGVQGLYDTLGQVADLRNKSGGANKLTSPADQAEFNRLVNKATIAFAQSRGISLADKQSQEFARDAILGADPSSYNISDVAERIKRTLSEETAGYQTTLQGQGYRGPLPSFVDLTANALKEDPAFQNLLETGALGEVGKRRGGNSLREIGTNIGAAVAGGGFAPTGVQKLDDTFQLPAIQRTLNTLYAAAIDPDPTKSKFGMARLQGAATGAASEGVRALAQQYLDRAMGEQVPQGGERPTIAGVKN